MIAPPGGCRWCAVNEFGHAQRYHPEVGWHGHAKPTDAQILTRMRANRAHRKASRP